MGETPLYTRLIHPRRRRENKNELHMET